MINQGQHDELHRLLEHAWDHSPFYRERYESHGIRRNDLAGISIQDVPLISKSTLVDRFDDAVTDPRLRKSNLEEWIHRKPDPHLRFVDDLIVVHSSGSSGPVALFPYNDTAWRVADIAVASRLPYAPNHNGDPVRAAFYMASHGHFALVSIAATLRRPAYETLILSVLDSRPRVVKRLNAFSPQRLYGYASSIADLAKLALEGVVRIQPSWVLVTGDKLTPSMETLIRDAWHAPIYVSYGAAESKYIALKKPELDGFDVLDELNVVEVLNQRGRAVAEGLEGRVVVTNLYNYTLPIIRYQFDDYVVVDKQQDGITTTIRDIRGRESDALPVLLDDGTLDSIHPLVLSEFRVPGLHRIQFVSRSPQQLSITYVASGDVDGVIRHQFQELLDMKGAPRTRFDVHRVREIANDPKTGKLKLVRRENATVHESAYSISGVSSLSSIADTAANRAQYLHKVFERQVRLSPDDIAITCHDGALTYAQLNARANQLAWHLRGRGVQAGAVVGLCVPRSTEMVVAILGILKAGAAWVPLDERYPAERLSFILDDACVSTVITTQLAAARLPGSSECPILLDKDGDSISGCSIFDPPVDAASSLAYVIYTSGSTGRPKGVMISHANLCHYVDAMRERLAITEHDVCLHTASIGFSSSVRQLMVPLTSGARVVVATPEEIGDPLSLFATVRDERVTVLDFIPSYWRICIDTLTGVDETPRKHLLENDVRLIASASELLLADVPRRWRALGHRAQLVNMFGLTETAGVATTYTIPEPDDSRAKSIPIGYPIRGAQVYVLDEHYRDVAQGEIGELFVAGPTVGVGYVNQPAQSKERFVRDSFRAPSDGRLCRTGDMARFRADGSLEFVGRVDDQIKIGGIRIEIGEVEAVLREHPAVREAAVIGQKDTSSGTRLVAYVAAADGEPVSAEELRRFIGGRLPESMIPSAFVTVESLPRLPNGKLDRQALPVAAQTRRLCRPSFVPPRNVAEWRLARIWESVLAVVGIGITDNFFDLGGNSLAGLYMLARVGEAFGRQLPVTAVLRAQTIEEMARLLEDDPVQWTALVPLQPHGSKAPFFWIHGDKSDAFLPRYLDPDQPVYALVHQSQNGTPARFTTVEQIARHYLREMRMIQPAGPYLLGGFCFGGLVAFEIAHQLKEQGDEVRLLALVEPSPLQTCRSSPVRLSPPPAKQPWFDRVRKTGLRNLHHVRQIGIREGALFVARGTVAKAVASFYRVTARPSRTLKATLCRGYHWLQLAAPFALRSSYILSVYRRARRKYEARIFPGAVSVFVDPEHVRGNWTALATGEVDVHEIPFGHEAILVEPAIEEWAVALKGCIERAQSMTISAGEINPRGSAGISV